MVATKSPAKKVLKVKKGIRRQAKQAEAKVAETKPAVTKAKGDDAVVTLERRNATVTADRRGAVTIDRRAKSEPVAVERRSLERRAKVSRRRQIDPTTCERDYTLDEIEFMSAMDDYKRRSGRMFPTCSEVLEVLKRLGYQRSLAPAVATDAPTADAQQDSMPQQAVTA